MAIDHKKAEEAHRERLRAEEFRQYERNALGKNSATGANAFVQGPSVLRRRKAVPKSRGTGVKLGGM
jgi:hypothetical protein